MRPARNILLVEDEPTLQRIFGSVLTDVGHRVESVGTAEHALERLRDRSGREVDLVLSDKNLPSMNGLDLLAEVRALEAQEQRAMGFVLVTGYPSRDSALRVLAHDGDGYLVKPFASLREAVERVQRVLDSDLPARRRAAPQARLLTAALTGAEAQASAGLTTAVLVRDGDAAGRIQAALAARGVPRVDIDALPAVGSVAVIASIVTELAVVARKRPGAALVLVDPGPSFADTVTLIGCGGGAILDPGLVSAQGGD